MCLGKKKDWKRTEAAPATERLKRIHFPSYHAVPLNLILTTEDVFRKQFIFGGRTVMRHPALTSWEETQLLSTYLTVN